MTLTEQVFRKMGWTHKGKNDINWGWYDNDFTYYSCDELPPIDSQWEVTAKYLVPFMRERGWNYRITSLGTFAWEPLLRIYGEDAVAHKTEIKDDNIAKAACLAFMEVEL